VTVNATLKLLASHGPAARRGPRHSSTAEGLLAFLPSAAQDLLFERIQALTAVGSKVSVEAPGPDFTNREGPDRQRAQMQHYCELAAQLGAQEHDFPDFKELWYLKAPTDVGDRLRGHGWDASVLTTKDMMAIDDRHPLCSSTPPVRACGTGRPLISGRPS
jgi:O-methyltransferase involved in polyketide biosynthesis